MSRNLPIIQSPLPNQHPSIQNLTANRHISPSRANYQSYRQSKIDFISQSTPKRAPRVSPVSILNLELNEVVSSAKKPVKTEATPKAPLNLWSESRSPKNAKLKFLQMKRNPSRQAGDFSATRTKLNIFQDNSADIKSFIIKRRHPSQLKDNSSDRSVLPRIESSFKKVREQEGSTSRKTTRSIESLRIVKNTSSKDVKVLEQYKIDVQNQIKQLQKTKTIEDTNVNTDLSEPYKLGSTKCVDPSELGSDRFASDKYESHTKLPERPTRQRITITTNQLISDKSLEDIDEKYFLFDDPLEMDYPLEDSEDNLDGFSDDMDTVIMDRGDYMHVREPLQDRLSVEPVESQILQRRYNSNSTSNLLNSPTLSSERGKNSPTTMVDGRNQSLLIKSHVMEPNNHTKMLSVFVKRRLEMLSGEKIDETEDENTTTQMM